MNFGDSILFHIMFALKNPKEPKLPLVCTKSKPTVTYKSEIFIAVRSDTCEVEKVKALKLVDRGYLYEKIETILKVERTLPVQSRYLQSSFSNQRNLVLDKS
ncbi:hypothetical protein CK516_19380 [Nostoc sp. 'Peltigera malacea cyanobiont' DB3992]|nr:hypothetical protein CK516_19380 [Nostoc sp. 'Peltigera malacea cyanobiont' DB3992]